MRIHLAAPCRICSPLGIAASSRRSPVARSSQRPHPSSESTPARPALLPSAQVYIQQKWLRDYFKLVLFGYDNGSNPDRDPVVDQDGAFFVCGACMSMLWYIGLAIYGAILQYAEVRKGNIKGPSRGEASRPPLFRLSAEREQGEGEGGGHQGSPGSLMAHIGLAAAPPPPTPLGPQ